MKGSSSHFCLLIEKPENCPQESFDALHEVFVGDVCDGQFPIFGGEMVFEATEPVNSTRHMVWILWKSS